MVKEHKIFLEEAEQKAFDMKHRATIRFNISKYDAAVEKGKARYKNLEAAKQQASAIKTFVINNLDALLLEFEEKITKRGAKVFWAIDAQEAIDIILDIFEKKEATTVVKSKSMTTEEIALNHQLEMLGVESVETDLGEFIVQIANEPPYHIVTPAMHKSKEDISELFENKFSTPPNSSPEFITKFVRNYLRDKFQTADVGITGANFIIADIGGISVTENEGNALLSVSFPKTHIVIAGIEKVIPKVANLSLMLPLLAVHGTGQQISVYNTLITGPKQADEFDGPEEMYVILLDNGRTNLLMQKEQRLALKCIRCGACLNSCPIYKNIGGHTYKVTYTGPIGSIISPIMLGFKKYKHLSFACSLCGKCSEVCPVKIELHKLIIYNRRDAVKNYYSSFGEQIAMKVFGFAAQNRCVFDIAPTFIRSQGAKLLGTALWGKRRVFPTLKKSFAKQFKSRV